MFRMILMAPFLLAALPSLLIIGMIVLTITSGKRTMISILFDDIRSNGMTGGVALFMSRTFIPVCRNGVQAVVLGGAGILVVTVGLRGLGSMPIQMVYASLGLEFVMLQLWSIMLFFTNDDDAPTSQPGLSAPAAGADNKELIQALQQVAGQLANVGGRLSHLETKIDGIQELEHSVKTLSNNMNHMVSDQFQSRMKKEFDGLIAELAHRAAGNGKTH